jgi:peptide/histidine transporter 3/4
MITIQAALDKLHPEACGESSCVKGGIAVMFYTSLCLYALGMGGVRGSLTAFGADQFDEFDTKEKKHKLSFFNWWMFSIFVGTLFANSVLVYIQDNVGWTLGYALPTLGLAISIIIFLVGTPFYRHKVPRGSPFTKMAKVIVAAIKKWNVPIPSDPKELYELDLEEYAKKGNVRIDSTPTLRYKFHHSFSATLIFDSYMNLFLFTIHISVKLHAVIQSGKI